MNAPIILRGSDVQDFSARDAIVPLISEFLRMPVEEVRRRFDVELERPGSLVAEAWKRANPRSEAEILRFYSETDAYIFDLAVDHCRQRRHDVWQKIGNRIEKRQFPQRILVYGDGIGTDSIYLAVRGHSVTYYDLSGLTSGFACYRFKNLGLSDYVRVIYTADALPRNYYDVVISIEVLEHLCDPLQAMHIFHDILKVGGIALITESFGTVGPEYPSHLLNNCRLSGQTHHIMERLGFASTYYSAVPANYPMEFTRVARDFEGMVRIAAGFVHRALYSRLRVLGNTIGKEFCRKYS